MRRARSRVHDISSISSIWIENILLATIEVAAMPLLEFFFLAIITDDTEMPFVKRITPANTEAVLRPAFFRRLCSVNVEVQTVVSAGDNIDDTRHRVRTIHCRCTVLQHFNAINSDNWQHIQVGRRNLSSNPRGAHSPAIQKHQSSCRA